MKYSRLPQHRRVILDGEWADAAAAGMDTQAAQNGDVVALISVLDYIVSQMSPLGGVFEMLRTLKLGDHLGLSRYDNIIGGLQSSQYADVLVSRIGNLEVIEAIAIQGETLFDKWVMPDGTSTRRMINTFESK
jgi:hypothetical protein